MPWIKLRNSRKKAKVSTKDYKRINRFKWFEDNSGYAYRKHGKKRVLMHRAVTRASQQKGKQVHHKNRERLDNRKKNLEVLSPKEHRERHRQEKTGPYTKKKGRKQASSNIFSFFGGLLGRRHK